ATSDDRNLQPPSAGKIDDRISEREVLRRPIGSQGQLTGRKRSSASRRMLAAVNCFAASSAADLRTPTAKTSVPATTVMRSCFTWEPSPVLRERVRASPQ